MTNAEIDQNQPSVYAESAEHLLALLDTDAEPDPATAPEQRYFNVIWEDDDPAKIDAVTLMTAQPTGARRHEHWGQLFSAQFMFTETAVEGDTTRRFEWCYTGPSDTGTQIKLNTDALLKDYGYEPLSADNVVHALTERATVIDDYIALTKLMQQRRIEPVPSLISSINKLTFMFVQGRPGPSDAEADYDHTKMFELISQLQMLGSDMPRVTQGMLVGHIMREIALQKPGANRAAILLEEALAAGILPDEPRIMNRVFAHGHIYKYQFATEFLHAKLEDDPGYGSRNYIFGEKRNMFVMEYISAILEARRPESKSAIANAIASSWRTEEPSDSPNHLYRFINDLLDATEILTGHNGDDRLHPPVTNYTEIVPAFRRLLSAFPSGLEELEEAVFNEKCADIVDTVLSVWVGSRLGDLATVTVLYDERDVLRPDEEEEP